MKQGRTQADNQGTITDTLAQIFSARILHGERTQMHRADRTV